MNPLFQLFNDLLKLIDLNQIKVDERLIDR